MGQGSTDFLHVKDVLMPMDAAEEHGAEAAILECDYYDDGSHRRQGDHTLVINVERTVPTRLYRVVWSS